MNILLNMYNFDESWARTALQKILKKEAKVLIIPFSFHDEEVQGNDDWVRLYSKKSGIFYQDIIRPFLSYGIKEENIVWMDYFLDTMETGKSKILHSDIIFFTGGLPDKMMERLEEAGFIQAIQQYNGIIMGASAGAMIQFFEYHITPDSDYEGYSYQKGFNFIRNYELEVHYEDTDVQRESIRRYKRERNKPVYAMGNQGGIIDDSGKLTLMGDVKVF